MRVLLVNPTARFEIVGNNPTALEESRGCNPPLGILLLAGYLERHTAHAVRILDAQAERLDFAAIAARLRAERPDVVGVTTMTQTLLDVLRIVEIVHAAAPSAAVVLGGPHVHLFPEETARLPGVDYLVLGEGEVAFARLLDAWGDDDAIDRIPGLAFARGDEVVRTGPPALIEDLDALPFPARHLTDVRRYDSVLAPRGPVTTLFTSRGCPYVCAFCDRPHLGKRFRARSAPNVVDEIQACVALGVRELLVYDDTFTVRRERVVEICREIGARRLDVGFDIRARVDTVDAELLALLARAGCRGVHYGVEAGSPEVLAALRKGIDLEQARRAFAATRAAGIQTLAYFMIGNPGETREQIRETFRVARELDPHYLHLTVLTPFPGTAIYRDGVARGLFGGDPWREFAARPHLGFVPPHWGERFTRAELDALLAEGYRSFYARPRYLARRLAAVRSPSELARKARAGLKLLTMRAGRGSTR